MNTRTSVKEPDDRALLESIFRAAPVGIGLVRNRILARVNDRLLKLTGYSRAELVGQSARMLYPTDEDFRYVGEEKYRQIREHGTGTLETRWQRKDGQVIDVLLSSTPLDLGNLDAGVTFSVLDITERRRAADALGESLSRYRDLVELSPDAIVVLQGGGYQFVNSSFTRIFGYTQRDVDEGLRFMNLVQESDRSAVLDRYARRLAGEPLDATFRLELLAKDGRVVPCETSATVIRHGGEPADLVIMRDISERVQREEARRRWEARMLQAQKLESLGVLAGGIAHDFNNLLVGIMGNAGLALSDLDPATPGAASLRDIEAAAVRAADLVRQLLSYAGKGAIQVQPIELRALVQEMVHLLHASISKKATLNLEFDDDTPTVEGDVTELRQVVMNLITNASEALGGAAGTITIGVRRKSCGSECLASAYGQEGLPGGTYACLEVSDTGLGMDQATLARIFDPFFTTKFAGRGLGLAAALGIVRSHGGAVRVESAPGQGTHFQVLLPPGSGLAQPVALRQQPVAGWRGSGTILLADDEAIMREVGERALAQLGFTVVLASNGREALETFRQKPERFALVLLDLAMPELAGDEALVEIRALRSEVPVLLASGYGELELADRTRGHERIDFIGKPFRLGELQNKLRGLLG